MPGSRPGITEATAPLSHHARAWPEHPQSQSALDWRNYTFVQTINANSSMPAMVTSDPAIATGSSAILPDINA